MAKPEQEDSLERAIIGALRSTIAAHGPITKDWIGSAAKRIMSQLPNARADGLARALGRRRWAGLSQEERQDLAGSGGRSAWAGMTKAERSAEMKRRAGKAWETRRAKQAKSDPEGGRA